MLEQWISTGIGWGIKLFSAGFTFLILVATMLGIIGAIQKIAEEMSDDHKPGSV